jgi:hypothetical protein
MADIHLVGGVMSVCAGCARGYPPEDMLHGSNMTIDRRLKADGRNGVVLSSSAEDSPFL